MYSPQAKEIRAMLHKPSELQVSLNASALTAESLNTKLVDA